MYFVIPEDLLDRRDQYIAPYCRSYEAILAACRAAKDHGTGPSHDYPRAVESFRRAAEELEVAEEAIRRFLDLEFTRLKRENGKKRSLALKDERREIA